MWTLVFALLTSSVCGGTDLEAGVSLDDVARSSGKNPLLSRRGLDGEPPFLDQPEPTQTKSLFEILADSPEAPESERVDPNCPKPFGLFPVPSSCTRFYHCRKGLSGIEECPANTVFEKKSRVCVHPDQSNRTDCVGSKYHNVSCPPKEFYDARFGDHDRIPHPSDCSKFFICFLNGQPRLGSCPYPMAFHPDLGFCQHYKHVRGCESFYDEEGKKKV